MSRIEWALPPGSTNVQICPNLLFLFCYFFSTSGSYDQVTLYEEMSPVHSDSCPGDVNIHSTFHDNVTSRSHS